MDSCTQWLALFVPQWAQLVFCVTQPPPSSSLIYTHLCSPTCWGPEVLPEILTVTLSVTPPEG